MRIDLRWQLLLAAICVALLVSLLGYQVQQTGLCTTRVAARGGQIVEGVIGRPQYLNPLLDQHNPVDAQLTDLIFDGLIRYGANGEAVPDLASDWQVSDDGRTFTFTLREDARWHDGEPVTVADVAFTYGLLQDESFPAPESLRELWQTVVISPTAENEISFILPQPYGPFIEAASVGIVPEHILGDVPPDEIADHSFNRAPVGTGPFMVLPGDDWQQSGSLRLAPNPLHWRQGSRIDYLEYRFFEDSPALLKAFSDGDIQAVMAVPEEGIAELGAAQGMRLYSAPADRYTQMIFNLGEGGAEAIKDVSIRQALAMALDREKLIDVALSGQGLTMDGPYLPQSWAYVDGQVAAFDYDVDGAEVQLDAAGWTLSEGTEIRQRDGQDLKLRLLVIDEPRFLALAASAADQWAMAGIGIELSAVPAEDFMNSLAAREFDLAIVDIEPGGDPDLYDFWSQEAIVRGQNYGGWNNRRASEALENGRRLTSQEERRPYYQAFQRYFDSDLPALTLYQHVYTYGLSDEVQEADIGLIDSPRDRYANLGQWFLSFQEVDVPCP